MRSDPIVLTEKNAAGYLVERGLLRHPGQVRVKQLGGGISNLVFLIEWLDLPERRWVLKQSLEKLRVKDDWRSERARILREADAIQQLGPLLGSLVFPTVIHTDHANFAFVMTAAPSGYVCWKEVLLTGQVDLGVARRAGSFLAKLLALSQCEPALQARFADRKVFVELRINPYYRAAAACSPEMRPAIEEIISESWETRWGLVHGDYSPKNILVHKGEIFLIDFEVIHWGDPAFDASFLLSHLFLKAVRLPRLASKYFAGAREFWEAVAMDMTDPMLSTFESHTVQHVGALMLARVCGKSPVEYISDERSVKLVKAIAREILWERPIHVIQVIDMVSAKLAGTSSV